MAKRMGGGFGGKRAAAQRMPPDGRLRQSQLITSFGAGAIVDLVDDAVLIGGLDFWRMPNGGEPVAEPRLRAAVAEVMAALERPFSYDRPFLRPPAGDEDSASPAVGIQAYEFPRWFICQNPKCRALVKAAQLVRRNNRYWHTCDTADRSEEKCVPVRFVAACPHGHLDDVNWPRWSHDGELCAAPRLRFDEAASGDFGDVQVRCQTCGKGRHLIDFMALEKAPFCSGERPWLGPQGREDGCKEKQRLLIRTASNTYFGQSMSALSIPERASARDAVQSVWDVLQAVTTPESLALYRAIPKVKAALGTLTDAEVMAEVQAVRENRPVAKVELRTDEFSQFLAQKEELPGEMPPDDLSVTFWARRFTPKGGLPEGIGRLVLARRLREVVTQIGFTRLEPASVDLQGRYDLNVKSAPLGLQQNWLPASEIRGEGFFVQLDEERVRAWEERPAVQQRISELKAGFDAWKKARGSKMEFPGGRFYLVHSLAHVLINAVSLECGYPASAIKERIYVAPATAKVPMAALLLSTGTSGVEGTLGGLVEEGRRIGAHLERAINEARLCSNDPVCAHHRPADAAERHLEGAACHGCLFVAECSCERFNQLLDRALVAPSLGHADVAYFQGTVR